MKKMSKLIRTLGFFFLMIICTSLSACAEERIGDYEILETARGTCTISKYYGDGVNVVVPDKIKDLEVNKIGEEAFSKCKSLVSIELPKGVLVIEDKAFYYCPNLERVSLPLNLEIIGVSAFSDCVKLKSIEIPDSVTSIGREAFMYCKSLEAISLPRGLRMIDEGLFKKCFNLVRVFLPEGIEKICSYAFFDCIRLEEINLPQGLQTIEYRAFDQCEKLVSITVPDSVMEIGPYALYYYGNLTAHVVPGSYAERHIKSNGIATVSDALHEEPEAEVTASLSISNSERESFDLVLPNWVASDSEKERATDFILEPEISIGIKRQEPEYTPEPSTAIELTENPSPSPLKYNDDELSLDVLPELMITIIDRTSESPEESELLKPHSDNNSFEIRGSAIGTTGNQVTVIMSIYDGVITECRVVDETETVEIRTGYDLACEFFVGKPILSLSAMSKKEFLSSIREFAQKEAKKLTNGGDDTDAALNVFLAMKDAAK